MVTQNEYHKFIFSSLFENKHETWNMELANDKLFKMWVGKKNANID